MRVLITGGAGFIGSNLIRHILTTTDDVRVTTIDALTYAGNLASLTDIAEDPRYRFVRGDVCDPTLMNRLASDADAIIHLAAESHVDRSIDGPADFLRTNVTGAGVVFEAARRNEVQRIVHVSTDEVYGSIPPPRVSIETDPLEPNSPYAASKAGAELLARSYRKTYGYPITVTRTTNTFGPYQHPEKVIPLFLTNLFDGEDLPLYGDGSNVRQWLYVADSVAAQWLALTVGEPGEVYNVGADGSRSNLQLATAILGRSGLEGEAGRARITPVADRPGHDHRYAVDSTKLRRLGWAPSYDFEQALDLTAAWYRDHEHWWRPLKEAGATSRRGQGYSELSQP